VSTGSVPETKGRGFVTVFRYAFGVTMLLIV
jgi:hypothetical protein